MLSRFSLGLCGLGPLYACTRTTSSPLAIYELANLGVLPSTATLKDKELPRVYQSVSVSGVCSPDVGSDERKDSGICSGHGLDSRSNPT